MSADPMPTIKDILGYPQESAPASWHEEQNALHDLAQAVRVLAEQQRIGNIIAWEQVTGEKNRALIRESLGLS